MKLRTLVRDGLYLNWALPAAALPPPPPSLTYEVHSWQGSRWVFATALLFRQQGLHLPLFPYLRLSHPQLNLRLYVVDGDGVPGVLFRAMLVPRWVVPAARLVGRQPASGARFAYPQPSRRPGEESWSWRVERGGRALALTARPASPAVGEGPDLGGWEKTLRYFRDRPRGYAELGGRLRRIETEQPTVAVWPLAAEIDDGTLLTSSLPLAAGDGWPALHSAWLCPEIPFTFVLGRVPQIDLSPGVPQAAASTRSRL